MNNEFESALSKFGVHFTHTKTKENSILQFSYTQALKALTVSVVSKTSSYQANLTQEALAKHKEGMGFNGSWEIYFNLLKNAINRVKKGEVALDDAKLTISYPISDLATIKGDISLNIAKIDYFEMLQSLYKEFQYTKESAAINEKESTKAKEIMPKAEPKKRKNPVNLVNPFAHKKLLEGAKIH